MSFSLFVQAQDVSSWKVQQIELSGRKLHLRYMF